MRTRTRRFHSTPPKPGSRDARLAPRRGGVDTVGVRSLTDSQSSPPAPATAASTTSIRALRANSSAQHAREVGLRLERDHAAAERGERAGAVADVRADVEHEVARLRELAVEPLHAPLAPRNRVIDEQRSGDAEGAVGPAHARLAASRRTAL